MARIDLDSSRHGAGPPRYLESRQRRSGNPRRVSSAGRRYQALSSRCARLTALRRRATVYFRLFHRVKGKKLHRRPIRQAHPGRPERTRGGDDTRCAALSPTAVLNEGATTSTVRISFRTGEPGEIRSRQAAAAFSEGIFRSPRDSWRAELSHRRGRVLPVDVPAGAGFPLLFVVGGRSEKKGS